MTRSADSTRCTKIAGLPNFAPHWFKSVSVTRREQAPQENMGMYSAAIFLSVSLRGGQPTGTIASAVALRIK